METRIPFGVDAASGRLVDVFEVQRGKSCNCTCPSCNGGLVARQGDVNIWHFAHDPNTENKSDFACEYAFWTSVQLMANQILSEVTELKTPACIRYINQEKKVVSESVLIPENRTIKTELKNVLCDAVYSHKSIDVGIVLIMPGRSNPYARAPLSEWKDWTKGLLEIDLSDLEFALFGEDRVKSFKNILVDRIVNGIDYKTWKLHPKEVRYFVNEGQRLTTAPTKTVSSFSKTTRVTFDGLMPVENNKRAVGRYHCLSCDYKWDSVANHQCPGCHARNYRRMY